MPSPLIIPFNYQPVSTSIKTASYTIPAGKYAYVKVVIPRMFINGVAVHSDNTYSVATTTSLTRVLCYMKGYYATGSLVASGTGTSTASWGVGGPDGTLSFYDTLGSASRTSAGTTALATVSSSHEGWLWIAASNNNATTATVNITLSAMTDGGKEFWVPSGTVLDGPNYIVSEYNVIS